MATATATTIDLQTLLAGVKQAGTLPETIQSNILLVRQYMTMPWTDDSDEGQHLLIERVTALDFSKAILELHYVRSGTLSSADYATLVEAIDKANVDAIYVRRISALGTVHYAVGSTTEQKVDIKPVPESLSNLLSGKIGYHPKGKGILMGDTVLLHVREAIQTNSGSKSAIAAPASPRGSTRPLFQSALL